MNRVQCLQGKKLKSIILLCIFISSVFATEDLEKISLQLKWKYQFQFAGFIAAKEKGFYEDVGLDVDLIEFDSSIDIINNVKNSITDFGISDSSIIYDALHGEPISALMVIFQESPFVLMGLKSSGIQTLKDIDWKTLALYEGIDGIAIKTMLKSNHIDYIAMPPLFSMDKLISGEVDMMTAYISNEPYVAKRKNIEVITFSPRDYGFEGYGDILFTSKNMLKNHPEVVKKMHQASYKGWNYAFNHIDEMVDIIYE